MLSKTAVRFEVKSLDDAGQFVGLAAVFGNRDLGDDVILPGAFQKTIREKSTVPVLLGHSVNDVVGTGALRETQQGLEINGKLILQDNPPAQRAYALMKGGALRGLSIGYDVVRHSLKNGVRLLHELKLFEVSLTAFPLNELATVTAVKSHDDTRALQAIDGLRRLLQKGR